VVWEEGEEERDDGAPKETGAETDEEDIAKTKGTFESGVKERGYDEERDTGSKVGKV
jgi:hypothetical protein